MRIEKHLKVLTVMFQKRILFRHGVLQSAHFVKTALSAQHYCDPLPSTSAVPLNKQPCRVCERRKPRRVTPACNIKSFHPIRENIWEYLNDDKAQNFDIAKSKHRKTLNKRAPIRRFTSRNIKLLIFFLLAPGFSIFYFMPEKIARLNAISTVFQKEMLNSILGPGSTSVSEECCHRMKYLAAALSRAEEALRSALRLRKAILISSTHSNPNLTPNTLQKGYIPCSRASKGSNTTEYGSRVSLWGVVPLWRAAPPPETVLTLRAPTPSDCWPFRGSYGEVIVELPRNSRVDSVSVEHVRPDTARSAPKHFVLYGILGNNTWIKAADGVYRYNKPAKQYFTVDNRNIPFKQIVFRVLSNQGNPNYTCIYRVHLYSDTLQLLNENE